MWRPQKVKILNTVEKWNKKTYKEADKRLYLILVQMC